MEDSGIVELYWQRDEKAVELTAEKYGSYLSRIARNILENDEDSCESVNDVYFCAWESIPPHRPNNLRAYLVRLVRQISIDRYRRRHSLKRIGSEYALSLEELSECICGADRPESAIEANELAGCISDFLFSRPPRARQMFVCRYFYADSLEDIASCLGTTLSAVKSSLHRTRKALGEYLNQEGYL